MLVVWLRCLGGAAAPIAGRNPSSVLSIRDDNPGSMLITVGCCYIKLTDGLIRDDLVIQSALLWPGRLSCDYIRAKCLRGRHSLLNLCLVGLRLTCMGTCLEQTNLVIKIRSQDHKLYYCVRLYDESRPAPGDIS
jgi:hypothetical protein